MNRILEITIEKSCKKHEVDSKAVKDIVEQAIQLDSVNASQVSRRRNIVEKLLKDVCSSPKTT